MTATEGTKADRGDFAAFYARHRTEMVRLAFLLTRRQEVAEDLVHDCFVRLQPRFDQVSNPAGYLRQSVVNACRSYHRRGRREAARPVEPVSVDAPPPDPLWDAMARLPSRQRAVLVLRYYQDLSERDTAAALRCRPGTVKSLTSRALAALREVIDR
jgi:RNA polymerase sigma-70 factor (sigma-E family)